MTQAPMLQYWQHKCLFEEESIEEQPARIIDLDLGLLGGNPELGRVFAHA